MNPIITSNPVNRPHPLNAGLIGWWEVLPWLAGGPVLHDLMGRNHGVMSGFGAGYGWGGPPSPGAFGSILPDPAGTSLILPGGGVDLVAGLTSFTFSAWGRMVAPYNYSILMAGNTTDPLLGSYGNADQIHYQTSTGSMDANPHLTGQWHHFAATTSPAGSTIYIDGISQIFSSSITAGTNPGNIGFLNSSLYPASFPWFGPANRWKVWGRALSPADLLAEYVESLAGHPNTLNRYRYV